MKLFVIVMAASVAMFATLLGMGSGAWMGLGGVAAVGGAAYLFGRCPHRGPLALLPATTDFKGEPLPSRWYCDRCGQEWPAVFEKDQTPIQRFSGYDETKAVTSAKRAEELQDRQRVMALERAGLRTRTSQRKVSHAHAASQHPGVVQIGSRRSVAR